MIKVSSLNAKYYIDWTKILAVTSAAGATTLIFKHEGVYAPSIWFSAGGIFFVLAMFFFLAAYVGLVERISTMEERASPILVVTLVAGWSCYLAAFASLIIDFVT